MTLTEIAKFPRQDQICLLVINSKRPTIGEKKLAEAFYFNGRGYFRRVLDIARRHDLTSIRLPDVPVDELPGIFPAPTPDPDTIRQQFDAAPESIKSVVKDAHTAGLIAGLRDVTIYASREEADAAWDALPGYIHYPKYPPRK